jgi:hypothetical protein
LLTPDEQASSLKVHHHHFPTPGNPKEKEANPRGRQIETKINRSVKENTKPHQTVVVRIIPQW